MNSLKKNINIKFLFGNERIKMSQDKFLETFNSASKTIAQNYLEGTIPFSVTHLPGLFKQIDSAENDINDKWGKDLSIFKEAVKKWEELWLKAILKFKQTIIISKKKKSVSREPEIRETKNPANIFDIIQGG